MKVQKLCRMILAFACMLLCVSTFAAGVESNGPDTVKGVVVDC